MLLPCKIIGERSRLNLMSFDPPVYQSEKPSNTLSIAIVAARYNTILVEALIANTLNTLLSLIHI